MYNENITIQKIFEESSAISNGQGLIAPLGIKENDEIEYVDYSKINHLLVCGTSGSGKTTFVRTLLTSLIALNSPSKLKFCIFDSKHIDYMEFNDTPFLLVPVTHDNRKCSGIIGWALSEAKKREMLSTVNPDIIKDYSDIFIVLDDYAEIAQDQVAQESLYKLLQIGHRVKIHVIIVTTIALAKVISEDIKVNIPHRLSFYLPERRSSQVVIDQDGAETLDFPGEFIAKFYSKATTFRSIELSDLEIKNLCDFSKFGGECDELLFKHIVNNWNVEISELKTEYDEDILSEIESIANPQKCVFNFDDVDGDPFYDEAVQLVLETGMASTSVLQMKLKIGYARAVRIMDEMEANGVIGPSEGAKPRKVLINKE